MEGNLLVTIPKFAVGFVLGTQKRNLRAIEEETETQIFYDFSVEPRFYVKGNAVQQYMAKLKIKENAVSKTKFKN